MYKRQNTVSGDQALSLENINLDFSLDMKKLTSGGALLSSFDTGGIAGYNAGTIRGSENRAIVGYQHVGYNVGGIAGRSCGYITDCENSGAVYGRKDVGGICGQMEPYVEMQLSESTLSKLQTQLMSSARLSTRRRMTRTAARAAFPRALAACPISSRTRQTR